MGSHLPVHFLKLFFQFGYLSLYYTAVSLYLGFSGTPHSDASLLSFKMCPHPCKTRKKILVLCKLDLHFGVCGLGSLGKNVENEICPVQNPDFQFPFYVAELGRGEFVIEYDDIGLVFRYIFLYFLQLSASYVCSCVRLVDFLYELPCPVCSGSLGKEFKFIEIFHYLPLIISLLDYSYEYCLLYIFLLSVDHNVRYMSSQPWRVSVNCPATACGLQIYKIESVKKERGNSFVLLLPLRTFLFPALSELENHRESVGYFHGAVPLLSRSPLRRH